MRLPFQRWRPSQLFLAWAAYWVGLVVVTLGRAIALGYRVTQEAGEHGSINAGFNNDVLTANIINSGQTVWTGSTTLLRLVLLVAIPPLILWLIWLAGSSRASNGGSTRARNERAPGELNAPQPRFGIIETSQPSTPKRPAREES